MLLGRILNIFIVLMGIWNVIATFVFGYPPGAFSFWNTLLAGVLIAALAGAAYVYEDRAISAILDVAAALVGAWLVAAPFILSFAYNSLQFSSNPTIIGIVVIFLGGLAALQSRPRQPYATRLEMQSAGEPPQPVYGRGQGAPSGVQRTDQPAMEEQTGGTPFSIPDAKLLDAVVKKLDRNWQLSPSTIQVEAHHGVVTLSGEVDTIEAREIARQTAESVAGVLQVVNELHTPE